MLEELKSESSKGIELQGMTFAQKFLAVFASVFVAALIIVLPTII